MHAPISHIIIALWHKTQTSLFKRPSHIITYVLVLSSKIRLEPYAKLVSLIVYSPSVVYLVYHPYILFRTICISH